MTDRWTLACQRLRKGYDLLSITYMMRDQLPWETTDHDVIVEYLIVYANNCWFQTWCKQWMLKERY